MSTCEPQKDTSAQSNALSCPPKIQSTHKKGLRMTSIHWRVRLVVLIDAIISSWKLSRLTYFGHFESFKLIYNIVSLQCLCISQPYLCTKPQFIVSLITLLIVSVLYLAYL